MKKLSQIILEWTPRVIQGGKVDAPKEPERKPEPAPQPPGRPTKGGMRIVDGGITEPKKKFHRVAVDHESSAHRHSNGDYTVSPGVKTKTYRVHAKTKADAMKKAGKHAHSQGLRVKEVRHLGMVTEDIYPEVRTLNKKKRPSKKKARLEPTGIR